jgi:hypothetical protein
MKKRAKLRLVQANDPADIFNDLDSLRAASKSPRVKRARATALQQLAAADPNVVRSRVAALLAGLPDLEIPKVCRSVRFLSESAKTNTPTILLRSTVRTLAWAM